MKALVWRHSHCTAHDHASAVVTIADSLYRNHDDVVLLKYNCAESISTAESTAREAHITATQRQYSLTYLEVCLVNARYPLILSLILLHALVISPPLFFLPSPLSVRSATSPRKNCNFKCRCAYCARPSRMSVLK